MATIVFAYPVSAEINPIACYIKDGSANITGNDPTISTMFLTLSSLYCFIWHIEEWGWKIPSRIIMQMVVARRCFLFAIEDCSVAVGFWSCWNRFVFALDRSFDH